MLDCFYFYFWRFQLVYSEFLIEHRRYANDDDQYAAHANKKDV